MNTGTAAKPGAPAQHEWRRKRFALPLLLGLPLPPRSPDRTAPPGLPPPMQLAWSACSSACSTCCLRWTRGTSWRSPRTCATGGRTRGTGHHWLAAQCCEQRAGFHTCALPASNANDMRKCKPRLCCCGTGLLCCTISRPVQAHSACPPPRIPPHPTSGRSPTCWQWRPPPACWQTLPPCWRCPALCSWSRKELLVSLAACRRRLHLGLGHCACVASDPHAPQSRCRKVPLLAHRKSRRARVLDLRLPHTPASPCRLHPLERAGVQHTLPAGAPRCSAACTLICCVLLCCYSEVQHWLPGMAGESCGSAPPLEAWARPTRLSSQLNTACAARPCAPPSCWASRTSSPPWWPRCSWGAPPLALRWTGCASRHGCFPMRPRRRRSTVLPNLFVRLSRPCLCLQPLWLLECRAA